MAATLTRALGQEVCYNDVPPDVYGGFGFPGAEDLGNMLCFQGWLAENKNRNPLEEAL